MDPSDGALTCGNAPRRPRLRVVNRRHVLMAVSTSVAVVALAGCAQNPQDAAVVGGHPIRVSDVDVLTHALCLEASAEGASTGRSGSAPVSWTKGQAVASLVRSALDRQYAEAHHLPLDPSALAQEMGRYQPLINHLPKGEQAAAKHLISGIVRGQMELESVAVDGLRGAGQTPDQTSVERAVQAIETHIARRTHVSINPRYDVPGLGPAGQGAGSISVPVSSSAKAFGTPGSPSAPVSALPSGQRCG